MKKVMILLVGVLLALSLASCMSTPSIDPVPSIPQDLKSVIPEAGKVENLAYDCYYYTDINDTGMNLQKRMTIEDYVLEKRNVPIVKKCNVYLPYGYDNSKEYPVVFVLHGIGGDEYNDWLNERNPNPAVLLDNLIASGQIEPCVAVFPNGRSHSKFKNRSFTNQAGFYFFANELQNDLLPAIEARYSVKTGRDSRAICGLSMGGMQTINVGLCQSLKDFAWFGAFSAAPSSYSSDQIAEYVKMQNQSGRYPVKMFYNICGLSDDLVRTSHEAAVEGLAEKSSYFNDKNLIYQTMPGGHDYSVWQVGLYNFLRFAFGR